MVWIPERAAAWPVLEAERVRAAFYKWLQQEYCANAVLHFGMHGTVEWLPGAPLGDPSPMLFPAQASLCHSLRSDPWFNLVQL